MADSTASNGETIIDADGVIGPDAAPGMPQLDFTTFPNQIFWLIITLGAIYLILTKVALPRIESVLADRQSAITNDIAMAEELKLKAAEAEAAYEKALADARAESATIVAKARAEIQSELDAALADADAKIADRAKQSEATIAEIEAGAIQSVEEVAKTTAAEIVSAMGLSADQSAIDAAVNSRLKG